MRVSCVSSFGRSSGPLVADLRVLFKAPVLVGVSAYYFHGLHCFRLRASASRARGEILLPLCIVFDGVGQQGGRLIGGALVTELDEIVEAIVVVDGETCGIDGYDGVGQSERAALILQEHYVEGAGQHAGQGFQLLLFSERNAEIDGDHGVGIHFAYGLDGNVLDHAAIGQHAAIEFDGSENAGDGHAGAHGLGKRAIAQHDPVAA